MLAMRTAMAAAITVIAGGASVAHAEVDWARGWVTADGFGVANRAAPTPAAARGPARRLAEDAARKKLAPQLASLPLAEGGTLADKLGDAKVKAAVDRALAEAIVIDADPQTDGSWKLTMAVPIEAIRQALVGPRALAATDDGDGGPPVVIVDGAGGAKPAVGYQLGTLAAATIFVKDLPAWAKDAPRVKAKSAKAGVIDLAPGKATAATLFVIRK